MDGRDVTGNKRLRPAAPTALTVSRQLFSFSFFECGMHFENTVMNSSLLTESDQRASSSNHRDFP